MKRPLLFWQGLAALCALIWLAARFFGWELLQLAGGFTLCNLLPGLAALRLLGLHGRSTLWTAFAAGSLSAPLLGLALALAALRGAPAGAACWPFLGLCGLVLVWPGRRPRPGVEPPYVPEAARPALPDPQVVAVGSVLALVVASALIHPFVRQWSDGWFHAAVFNEVARGGVPPEFPHFAGQRLPYPWLFHVYLTGMHAVTAAGPFALIAALNVWVALLLPPAVYLLGRGLGATAETARWSALAAVLGVNPLGPLWLLGRSLFGETRLVAWQQALDSTSMTQVLVTFGFPFFQSGLLARLWTPTAFISALLLAVLVTATLFEVWRRPRPRNAVLLGLGLCLLLQWHTLTALALGFAIVVSLALALPRMLRHDRVGAGIRLAVIAGAAGAAALLARPYLGTLTLESTGGQLMRWHLSRPNLWGLVLAMGPVLIGAVLALPRLSAEARVLGAGLVLGLLVPFLTFDLPGPAEEKIFFPLFLLLAAASGPSIAAALERRGRGRPVVWAVALLGVAGAGITARAFHADATPLRALFTRDARPGVALFTPEEESALLWLRERSPRDAVVLQVPRTLSNEPVLVAGRRRLFLGSAEFFYRATFFESSGRPPAPPAVWTELQRRTALQSAVFSSRALTPDTLALLRSYPWPLYVWRDAALDGGALSPTLAAADSGAARTVVQGREVSILELVH